MTVKFDLPTLVRRAQTGDAEAFGRLVLRFQDMAVGYAYSRLGDVHLAEDAAQDAFLTAFRSLHQLREEAAFAGWLRAAVHSSCERIRRKRRTELSLEKVVPVADDDPAAEFEQRQDHEAVRCAIDSLPEEQRIAITLSYMGNCSHRQIADFLDMSLTTVNNCLRAARSRLAARLRNPTRRFLRDQAPSRTHAFTREVSQMIQPVEFQQIQAWELPGGYSASNTEVWQMLSACREGEMRVVRDLVERCPGLVHCEYNYTLPIHFAVREGHTPIVRYLLQHGADPTYRTYSFKDSLLQMARERDYAEIADLIEAALASRFPLSDAAAALLQAAGEGDVEKVQALLQQDAELVRASNETGDTALHRAAAGGYADIVELLLDRGADPEVADGDGFKPIHSAIFFNRQGHIRQHQTPPTDTLRAGRIAGLLLERGASYNIFLAAVFGDMPAVKKWLAEDSALANFADTHHRRPLSAAARRHDIDMMRLLLEHGADPSLPERDCPRGHALWIAALYGNVEMARLLLEHGADPESSAESGGKALDHARDNAELYQLLIEHGAEPKESPRDRLHNAISDKDLETTEALLKEYPDLVGDPTMFWGEGILVTAARDQHWQMVDLLLRYGAKVPEVSKWGRSYYFRHLDMAEHLLQKGMNPNHMNWHRTTLLHDMAHGGLLEKARLLLDHGADIDAVDEEYRSTPLGLAARAGHKELVELLLERGADPTATGAEWATPLAWAQKGGHEAVVKLLGSV